MSDLKAQVTDALSFAPQVDGIIMVIAARTTPAPTSNAARKCSKITRYWGMYLIRRRI